MIVEPILFFYQNQQIFYHTFVNISIYMGIKNAHWMTFGHLKEKEKKVSLHSNIENDIDLKPLTLVLKNCT